MTVERSSLEHRKIINARFSLLVLSKQRPMTQKKTVCQLCGETIPFGKIIAHKTASHGEQISGSTVGKNKRPTWTPIYNGGLTGLKK